MMKALLNITLKTNNNSFKRFFKQGGIKNNSKNNFTVQNVSFSSSKFLNNGLFNNIGKYNNFSKIMSPNNNKNFLYNCKNIIVNNNNHNMKNIMLNSLKNNQQHYFKRNINHTVLLDNSKLLTQRFTSNRQALTKTILERAGNHEHSKYIKWWLTGCCFMIFTMVSIGGITRLTESGLSMVQWQPIYGILPPRSEKEWQHVFNLYKQYPEYKLLNKGMELEEFKKIFFWEYLHRVWGRMIGLTFALPFLFFTFTGRLNGNLKRNCLFILGGIGLNGLLGWWMVKSGLKEKEINDRSVPRVSHYRLATHLGTAVALYCGTVWTVLELWFPSKNYQQIKSQISETARVLYQNKTSPLIAYTKVLTGLIFLTALSGALVAGLDAGLIYNEFPFMGNSIKPEETWKIADIGNVPPIYSTSIDKMPTLEELTKITSDTIIDTDSDSKSLIREINDEVKKDISFFSHVINWIKYNLFEKDASVQFNHRVLGITTALSTSALWLYTRDMIPVLHHNARIARHCLLGVVALQVTLGISTLLSFVSTPVAASHQAGSLTLLTTSLWFLHEVKKIRLLK
eukprot:TRINITY_DN14434_c0_g1_i1.p1 TRINITY_DN14434_c0_g1~~TRINITY_DN14434_c0_g1_i1.p1  ORF type:complete len:569 (+),score=130.29 TRINITY_DN14434_c0_g1_i1:55-1761(+)